MNLNTSIHLPLFLEQQDSFIAFARELFKEDPIDQIIAEIESHREHVLLRVSFLREPACCWTKLCF